MAGFDAASFWVGLGLGLVNGIALVCFTRAWRWAGLAPSSAGQYQAGGSAEGTTPSAGQAPPPDGGASPATTKRPRLRA